MLPKRLLKILCSLRLTLVLLILGLLLVFLGTMAQEPLGLYLAQTRFFHSFFVDAASMMAALRKSAQLLNWYVTPMQASEVLSAPWIPIFPGGYLIGGVLLANLIAAHLERFQFSRKKIGIFMVHAGLILLLLGQLMTDQLASESGMHLTQGETKNYSESDRHSELAMIDITNPDHNKVVVIPESLLTPGATLRDPEMPFSISVKQYYEHAMVTNRVDAGSGAALQVTQGAGARYRLIPLPKVTDMNYRDIPGAVVEVSSPDESLGTWLVHGELTPQTFQYKDRTFQMVLRLRRFYHPFSLTLMEFRHDKYKGTDLPRNFSSQVRLRNSKTQEDREVLIYMNNPLRYSGLTFYQASFDRFDQKATVLQVVRNPSWVTPYLACILVGAGLVVQFLTHLVGFIQKRIK